MVNTVQSPIITNTIFKVASRIEKFKMNLPVSDNCCGRVNNGGQDHKGGEGGNDFHDGAGHVELIVSVSSDWRAAAL